MNLIFEEIIIEPEPNLSNRFSGFCPNLSLRDDMLECIHKSVEIVLRKIQVGASLVSTCKNAMTLYKL